MGSVVVEVSRGFATKIAQWVLNEERNAVLYKPFESDSNPYKSRIFIVNGYPSPAINVEVEDVHIFINGLTDSSFMYDLFGEQLQDEPKDYKGTKKLIKWLKQQCETDAGICYSNAYMVDSLTELKALKYTNEKAFQRGQQIFHQVLEEFNADILLVHGTYALEQMKQQFGEAFSIHDTTLKSLKDIEEAGLYGELKIANRVMQVYVCRSLSTFTTNNAGFEQLRKNLKTALNS